MLSRILYLPFIVFLIIAFYLTFEVDSGYSWFIIPPVIALAAIFFAQPEIDWWWYQRNIPKMDPQLIRIISEKIPFYADLPLEDKKRFQNRVMLYVIANAFIAKGIKEDGEPPTEIKYFLAINVVQLTFGQADYRLPKFERMVIYPAPFPSPQYPEYIHSSETYAEDGVLIFALDPFMKGTINPHVYNIGLHEYAQAYIFSYPEKMYPDEKLIAWEELEVISGMKTEGVKKAIGLPEIDIRPVVIHHFFYYPEKMKTAKPGVYQRLSEIFNLDFLREGSPVIDRSRLGDI